MCDKCRGKVIGAVLEELVIVIGVDYAVEEEPKKPDLSEVHISKLLGELSKRGEKTEKLAIEAWKTGSNLETIEKLYGDYGKWIVEQHKEKTRIIRKG